MVIDVLDIFYPPYPSQLVVDVYQNVKHVFGVCIFCPHFDILWFDIILHSVHSCRGFLLPKTKHELKMLNTEDMGNTTKVRALDVIVPRPSTNINAKRISITRIYFAFFWESRNDRLNEFAVMLIYIYNNAMRSCNERTTLHCVESYLYYVILVNKKIFSEE
jgi:hypothetical protein